MSSCPERLEGAQNPVAADISILQSASSFITPSEGRVCPRASEAFDAIATMFCNARPLLLPLPASDLGDESILFLSLWESVASIIPVTNLELSQEGVCALSASLSDPVVSYIEGYPYDVARWVWFQFSDSIIRGVTTRGSVDAIRYAAPIASELLAKQRTPNFKKAVLGLHKEESWREPKALSPLVGTAEFPSFIHLCLAYVLSFCFRGWSYAANLSQDNQGTLYRHVWLRKPALANEVGKGFERTKDHDVESWFPWGTILTAVFATDTPLTSRSEGNIKEVLCGVRERWTAVGSQVKPSCFAKASHVTEQDNRLTNEEACVLDILREVGVFPRYATRTRTARLAEWLRTIAVDASPLMKLPSEMIASNLQPEWLRRVETSIRVRFRRDTFWDVFEDPGIRSGLKSIAEGRTNRIILS